MNMNTPKIYQALASAQQARLNCLKADNKAWFVIHTNNIQDLMKRTAPSGSGIDCGTKFDFDRSTGNKLVFTFSFHHMNEAGYYDGWSNHTAIVTPSLSAGFELRITGRNRNSIKESRLTWMISP